MRYDPSPTVAIYVHVPFCRARCDYCDFNTYAGLDHLMPMYVEALCQEIEVAGQRLGPLSVPTIYFGGGTPSLLPLDLFAHLIRALGSTFYVPGEPEITVEANPGTITLTYLKGLRALGVNRLSLGVQSAHDGELQMLGRLHSWRDAVQAIAWAREAGFENLNLDLIFGLPGQAVGQWQKTLGAALDLQPEHLSLYDLTVEEGTPLAQRIAAQVLSPVDEDRSAEMFELAERILARAGFFHYEISSWARMDSKPQTADCGWWPGTCVPSLKPRLSEAISRYVCRHNLIYWRNQPWLGLGAGAHSWMPGGVLDSVQSTPKGQRWANTPHPGDYIAAYRATNGEFAPRHSVEEIDRALEMGETMMLGLRLAEGVHAEGFECRFREPLANAFGDELEELRDLGLLAWDGSVARLTSRGRLLGNRVFMRFI
jgi:oxygen-independent coproporphyrinogen-3 oxidase